MTGSARGKVYKQYGNIVYMGLIRIVIPDELEEEMRRAIPAKKGALSAFVTEAIKEKLDKMVR